MANHCYSEFHLSQVSFMLSVTYRPFMLSAIMLNAFILSVIMMSVVAPHDQHRQDGPTKKVSQVSKAF
jgi:hypothetical protein